MCCIDLYDRLPSWQRYGRYPPNTCIILLYYKLRNPIFGSLYNNSVIIRMIIIKYLYIVTDQSQEEAIQQIFVFKTCSCKTAPVRLKLIWWENYFSSSLKIINTTDRPTYSMFNIKHLLHNKFVRKTLRKPSKMFFPIDLVCILIGLGHSIHIFGYHTRSKGWVHTLDWPCWTSMRCEEVKTK